jgi:hypothetical protein
MTKPKPSQNDYPFHLIVEKELSNKEVLNYCSIIFDLHPKEMIVVNSTDELYPNTEDSNEDEEFTIEDFLEAVEKNQGAVSKYNLIVTNEPVKGNFKTLIEFMPQNHTNLKIDQVGDFDDIAQRFAEVLDCKCMLIYNDNLAPMDDDYEEDVYVLFQNKQAKKTVYLNDILLEKDFYVILREKNQD